MDSFFHGVVVTDQDITTSLCFTTLVICWLYLIMVLAIQKTVQLDRSDRYHVRNMIWL